MASTEDQRVENSHIVETNHVVDDASILAIDEVINNVIMTHIKPLPCFEPEAMGNQKIVTDNLETVIRDIEANITIKKSAN